MDQNKIYAWCDATLTGNILFDGQTRMTVSSPGAFMRYTGCVTGASGKLLVSVMSPAL